MGPIERSILDRVRTRETLEKTVPSVFGSSVRAHLDIVAREDDAAETAATSVRENLMEHEMVKRLMKRFSGKLLRNDW